MVGIMVEERFSSTLPKYCLHRILPQNNRIAFRLSVAANPPQSWHYYPVFAYPGNIFYGLYSDNVHYCYL